MVSVIVIAGREQEFRTTSVTSAEALASLLVAKTLLIDPKHTLESQMDDPLNKLT